MIPNASVAWVWTLRLPIVVSLDVRLLLVVMFDCLMRFRVEALVSQSL
jgi:hypothetical protein